jgi:divalent metal cation (Fe/Co/Zn/Cd) transporter
VAASFYLLAPYVTVEAVEKLIEGTAAKTSWVGIGLTAGTLVLCPLLGIAKQRIGAKLESRATYGAGTQNLLCAILAGAVLVGLVANTLFRLWWLDPAIALGIAALCLREGSEGLARRGMRLRQVLFKSRRSGSTVKLPYSHGIWVSSAGGMEQQRLLITCKNR